MNVKADRHVVRVFQRLGFIDEASRRKTRKAAKELHPEYPGALDSASWRIGREWCKKSDPLCAECPMEEVCPKNEAKELEKC